MGTLATITFRCGTLVMGQFMERWGLGIMLWLIQKFLQSSTLLWAQRARIDVVHASGARVSWYAYFKLKTNEPALHYTCTSIF
jgi:hypothetical protein